MDRISCGGFYIGNNMKLNNDVLEVGSDNMTLTDSGLEVTFDTDTASMGVIEDSQGDEVIGFKSSDDLYLSAGNNKAVKIENGTEIDGALTVNGQITGGKEIILQSSTVSSTKQFKITVTDDGTISAVEV